MTSDRPKDPREYEEKRVKQWEEEDVYRFDPSKGGPYYVIDTPPPFTSGTLHLGHVYGYTRIDIAARSRRMMGYNVYMPQGFDCHGLPTELRVERVYGISKENREEFLKKAVERTQQAIAKMKEQFKRIGYSTDRRYEYHTMDDEYKALVQRTLIEFYKRGRLYRKKFPVHRCPKCRTVLAKQELGYVRRKGILAYIRCPVKDGDKEVGEIIIATTRPELLAAAQAILVHPEDERYKHLVGKKAVIPPYMKEVPIMADEEVDPEFGTGAVYVSTFGDEQDVKRVYKYNLPITVVVNPDGTLNENAGKLAGLPIEEARKKMVERLEELGYLVKVEEHEHDVLSHTERSSCMSPVELIPMEQRFIKVREFGEEILKAAREMKRMPPEMIKRLEDRVNSLDRDRVISRQRVFGTPLPFRYCPDGEIIVAEQDLSKLPVDPTRDKPPRKCKDGSDPIPEKDVADVRVDSSITPLRISFRLRDEELFKKLYPATIRIQGYEIIRTRLFYTTFRCLKLTGKKPFSEVLIHGMVAGPDGRKMSKSYGNVVAPEELIRDYGADAVRIRAAFGSRGEDYPVNYQLLKGARRFIKKLLSIGRFVSITTEDVGRPEALRGTDHYIIREARNTLQKAIEAYKNYKFRDAVDALRKFSVEEFSDNYIESVKRRVYENKDKAAMRTLRYVLKLILLGLAPVIPFTTEEIWRRIYSDKSIHLEKRPEGLEVEIDEDEAEKGRKALKLIEAVRSVKKSGRLGKMSMKTPIILYLSREAEGLGELLEDVAKTTVAEIKIVEEAERMGEVEGIKFTIERARFLYAS